MTTEAREWVLEAVDDRTTPEPDGRQNETSNVWTSRRTVVAEAAKTGVDVDPEAAEATIHELDDDGQLFYWNGLIAPTDPDHLRAVIESERLSGYPRTLLIGRINREYLGVAA